MIKSAFSKIFGLMAMLLSMLSENDAYAKLLNDEQKVEADRMKTEFESLRKKAKPKYASSPWSSGRR